MLNNIEIIQIGKLMYQNQPFIKRYTWDEANEYAKNLKLGGFDDWRLPTIDELSKIRHPELDKWEGSETWIQWMERHKNIISKNIKGRRCCARKAFAKNMPAYSFFWSSTEYDNPGDYNIYYNSVLVEYFNDIVPTHLRKENQDFVICVRG